MSKTRLTCDNCGFGEELGKKELKARLAAQGGLACTACGAALTPPADAPAPKVKKEKGPKAPKAPKKARYVGMESMTGLDDVIDGEIADGDLPDANPKPKEQSAPDAPAGDTGKATDGEAPTSQREEIQQTRLYQEGTPAEPEAEAEAKSGPAGAAEAARAKLKQTLRHGRDNPLFAAEMVSASFRKIAHWAHGCFDGVAAAAVLIGHYTLIVTSALALIFGLLISLRSFSLSPLLTGASLAAMLLFAQYLALRAFDLMADYVEQTPTRLPGPALPEVLSAFSVLLALLGVLGGLIFTISHSSPAWLGFAALAAIAGFFAAAAFLECRTRLNVSFEQAMPAGEIIVELVATKLKALVAVLPFVFGLGSAALAICMVWPVISMLLFSLTPINTASFFLQESGLLFCAFAPIGAYLFILLWAFILQIARALLGINEQK